PLTTSVRMTHPGPGIYTQQSAHTRNESPSGKCRTMIAARIRQDWQGVGTTPPRYRLLILDIPSLGFNVVVVRVGNVEYVPGHMPSGSSEFEGFACPVLIGDRHAPFVIRGAIDRDPLPILERSKPRLVY